MKRIMINILRILQGMLLVFLVLAGVGSMPSVMGMLFLLMAIFVTPRKVLYNLWEDWVIRTTWVIGLLIYFSYLPMSDVDIAARNMGRFLLTIWQGISSLWSEKAPLFSGAFSRDKTGL